VVDNLTSRTAPVHYSYGEPTQDEIEAHRIAEERALGRLRRRRAMGGVRESLYRLANGWFVALRADLAEGDKVEVIRRGLFGHKRTVSKVTELSELYREPELLEHALEIVSERVLDGPVVKVDAHVGPNGKVSIAFGLTVERYNDLLHEFTGQAVMLPLNSLGLDAFSVGGFWFYIAKGEPWQFDGRPDSEVH
jgi:hypothetical protein